MPTKPRETTARFTTKECNMLLAGMRTLPNVFLGSVEEQNAYHRIVKKLEHRIDSEAKKNATKQTT